MHTSQAGHKNEASIILPKHYLLKITGENVIEFLQKVVSQDLFQLPNFTFLLDPMGRYQSEGVIFQQKDEVLWFCYSERSKNLTKLWLDRYKFNKQILIKAQQKPWDCWVEIEPDTTKIKKNAEYVFCDPRGFYKCWGPKNQNQPFSSSKNLWDSTRFHIGILEDTDFIPGKSIITAYKALHGVSFSKGCYPGQEVISRTFYQGAQRKKVLRITCKTPHIAHINQKIAVGDSLYDECNKKIGTMLSSQLLSPNNYHGLCLINSDHQNVFYNGVKCKVTEVSLHIK